MFLLEKIGFFGTGLTTLAAGGFGIGCCLGAGIVGMGTVDNEGGISKSNGTESNIELIVCIF